MMEHQDWKEVRFPAKSVQQKVTQERNRVVSNLERKAVRALASDDPETLKVESFDAAFVQKIIQARVAKGWKQAELARALNEDAARIQRFEQRKEVYDPKLKAKLQGWLQKNAV